MLAIKSLIRSRDDMHPDIKDLLHNENWKQSETFLRPEDAMTVTAYCNMCKEDHRIALVAVTKLNKNSADIILLTPKEETLCSNMRRERDPIKLNFL